MIEEILQDLHGSDNNWRIALLRYFNPVGAHPSGRIGEAPNDTPNNLMPYISQVAIGKLEKLSVFGNNYPTHDGTAIRDYIHVVDLSVGHIRAIEKLQKTTGIHTWNLGVGKGYSVLEMIAAFEKRRNKLYPTRLLQGAPVMSLLAMPIQKKPLMNWVGKQKKGVEDMVSDSWRWQSANQMAIAVNHLSLGLLKE